MSVFRDIEAAVNEASDIVCNSGLDIGDIVVEHNKTEDEEERIAWFLEGGCLCKLLDGTLCSTQFTASMLVLFTSVVMITAGHRTISGQLWQLSVQLCL